MEQTFERESSNLDEAFNRDFMELEKSPPQNNTYTVVDRGPEALGPGNKDSSNGHTVMDMMDMVLIGEEKEDFPKHKNALVSEENENSEDFNNEFGLDEMVMELQGIMEGNNEFPLDNSIDNLTSLDGSMAYNQELSNPEKINMGDLGKCRKVDQQEVHEKYCSQQTSQVANSLLDSNLMTGIAESGENSQLKGSTLGNDPLEVDHNMQQEAMEMDGLCCTKGASSSFDHVADDVDVEEGEIHVDSTPTDLFTAKLSGEPLVLEEKNTNGMQVFDDMNMKGISYDGRDRSNEKFSGCTLQTLEARSNDCNGRKLEVNKSSSEDLACHRERGVQGDIMLVKGADVKNRGAENGRKQHKSGKT